MKILVSLTDVSASFVSCQSGSVWCQRVDWSRSGCQNMVYTWGDAKSSDIKKYHFGECTYKCFVLVRLSNPGFVPSKMGSPPVSLLSARSSQYSFERLPSDGGMPPVNLLEFNDLQEVQWTILSHWNYMQRYRGEWWLGESLIHKHATGRLLLLSRLESSIYDGNLIEAFQQA